MTTESSTATQSRAAFLTLLQRHCEQALNMGRLLGLIVVDIKRFKKINQVFGYKTGDAVLRRFASLLGGVARKSDLVAQIGDNAFAMILPGIMNEGHAVLAAAKLFRELEIPFEVNGQNIRISATAGLAVCPTHGSHYEVLLQKAEVALDSARRSREAYALASGEATDSSLGELDLEFELQSALSGGEFELFYQPKFNIRKMVPVGAEALIRWNSPFRGQVSPDEFIPVAEQSGLIGPITQWVLNTALRESNDWPNRFGPQSIAVNLPASIIGSPNLVDLVSGCMGVWESGERNLVLEVTETTAMADPANSFAVFEQLKELGAQISLDDFGTGYSSLAYFRDVPANELKLDKMFVSAMIDNPADRHIATLVIDLAHRFGMRVVAEGVEDSESYRLLAKMGCDHAQGYFIAKPMPQLSYLDWLSRYEGLTTKGARLRASERPTPSSTTPG